MGEFKMEFIEFNFNKSDTLVLTREQLISHMEKSISLEYEFTGDYQFRENESTFSTYIKVGVQRKMDKEQYLLF
jgi:hypothetical protein